MATNFPKHREVLMSSILRDKYSERDLETIFPECLQENGIMKAQIGISIFLGNLKHIVYFNAMRFCDVSELAEDI